MIRAVSSSCSQMKYSMWMNEVAAARSCSRRENFSAPVAKISRVSAGSGDEPLSMRMVAEMSAARLSPY